MHKKGMYAKYIKRALDFMIALIAILVLLPLFVIVSILIKTDSKGPIFFTQERPGRDQKIFKVYKFRTMVNDAVKKQKIGVEVTGSDPRVTSFGRFLRRFKIDELAQLVNVLNGTMSIVGPRPSLPEYIKHYEKWELNRFDVRPGLTGLAQVNGNIYLDRQEKSSYDIKYIQNISFVNDIKIILKTVAIIFIGEDKFINRSVSKTGEENLDI